MTPPQIQFCRRRAPYKCSYYYWPPVTVVWEVLYFARDVFLFFRRVISEPPRPITAKLRHMIGTCVNFIN